MPYCLVLKACKALMKYEAISETQSFKGSGFEQWTLHTRRQEIIEQCLKPSPDHFCNFPTLTVQHSRPLNHCWTGVLFSDNDLCHVLMTFKKWTAVCPYLNIYHVHPICNSMLFTLPSSEARKHFSFPHPRYYSDHFKYTPTLKESVCFKVLLRL